MKSGQVTIPAGGGPVALSTERTYCALVIIQNKAANAINFGGSGITPPGGTNKGITLAGGSPGGSTTNQAPIRGDILNNIYVAGTAADVIDYAYIPAP